MDNTTIEALSTIETKATYANNYIFFTIYKVITNSEIYTASGNIYNSNREKGLKVGEKSRNGNAQSSFLSGVLSVGKTATRIVDQTGMINSALDELPNASSRASSTSSSVYYRLSLDIDMYANITINYE